MDQSGAVIANATVTITEKATGTARTLTTNNAGLYSAPALLAGEYEVRGQAPGFRTLARQAVVTAGSTVTVDMQMALGQANDVVTVEAQATAINFETQTVSGTIARNTIQELPINGRSFLNLATLQPGVTVTTGVPAQFNSLINVQVLGNGSNQQGAYVRMTIDGGIINDEWEGNGSTSLNVSQEVVQEFQMSSVNFDATSGIGAGGQVNIVTRSGGNEFHGGGYFFFRDHNMAAFPGLRRPTDPLAFNPNCKNLNSSGCNAAQNPFFVRRDPGFLLGGPLKKDKLFFFFNYEYTNQVQAYPLAQDLPSLSGLSNTPLSPYHSAYITTRFDYNLSRKNSLFARFSHDGNLGFGPYGGAQPLQSSWSSNNNWSDQYAIGVTSLLAPNVVNEVRGFYHWWRSLVEIASASQCAAPCLGGGLPSLVAGGSGGAGMVGSSTFYGGVSDNSPQPRQERSYEITESLTWQKGAHRLKFGFDYERIHTNNDWEFCSYGCLGVYSPESTLALANPGLLAQYMANLPRTVSSTADLLGLPVFNAATSIYSGIDVGHGNFPGPYQRSVYNHNDRPRFYAADVWKVTPNLTLNGALNYEFETGLWYTLPYPSLLVPIVGNNLSAPPTNYRQFAPQLGFAYALGKDKKTVIRGGGGMFWDSEPLWHHFRAGASLGPLGNGRQTLPATALTNIFPNIVNLSNGQPLPIGASLPLNTLTNMTLGQFVQIYNQEIPQLTQLFAPTPPTSGPFRVSGLDVAKSSVEIAAPNFKIMRSYQTSLGVQRDLGHDMVLKVDWARRQFENVDLGELDLNRFNRPSGPIIPKCAVLPDFNPADKCSNGSMTFWVPQGRSVYEAMLLEVDKRFSNHFQFQVSYALQNQNTVVVPTQDLDNYFATYGPNLARHNLHLNSIVQLPKGFELSINQAAISRTPVEPVLFLPLTDPANRFGSSTLVPIQLAVAGGGDFNCFGQSCGKSDLEHLVSQYNSTYHRALTLPSHYRFGDPFFDTDFRLSKKFTYKERARLTVAGEVFNAFNIANLQLAGYNFLLGTPTFGQATTRIIQTFGSGGPRAFEVLARISF
jgi:Carboxypeptidase regulatory-like domain